MATPIKVLTVTHLGRNLDTNNVPQQYTITMELSVYNIFSPIASNLGYTILLVSDSTYNNPISPPDGSSTYNGGSLENQTLTANTPKTFNSNGITTVLGWSFKDSDGNFIDMIADSQNANNTSIQVTAIDDYTGVTIYYHGLI